MTKKRIAVIYDYCNLGGVTSIFKQRLRFLNKKDYDFTFLFAKDEGGTTELRGISNINVQICPSSHFHEWALACALHEKEAFDKIILIDQPEIVAMLSTVPEVKPKIIYEVHTSLERTFQRMRGVNFNCVEHVIVVSDWLKQKVTQYLLGYPDNKIHIIHNFVDEKTFNAAPATQLKAAPGVPTVIWVGKLIADKNYVDACRILKILTAQTKLRAIFVSGGQIQREHVSAFLHTLNNYGLSSCVDWLANIPNAKMPELYATVRQSKGCILSTSKYESFGLSLLEAMSCGVPVVSANVGGIPEVVNHERGGFLFTTGEIEQAAAYTRKIIGSKVYAAFSQQALADAARFSGSKITKRYASFLSAEQHE